MRLAVSNTGAIRLSQQAKAAFIIRHLQVPSRKGVAFAVPMRIPVGYSLKTPWKKGFSV
jgi:hypothetical protein